MKKVISMLTILLLLSATILSTRAYADEKLESVNITTDKQTVHPGEEITINVNFGQDLGSYTVDIAYDSNLLEYVSAEGGTPNDNGTRIRVYFYDETGGSSPSGKMSVKFKAKEQITTSNPTDLTVTAEGMANADASTEYEDISTPITKSIVVEPVKGTTTPQGAGNNGNPQGNSGGQTEEPGDEETTKQSDEGASENNGSSVDQTKSETVIASKEPKNMPKTGGTIYVVALSVVAVLIFAYAFIKIRK